MTEILSCDVLVVGGGPGGIAAATTAAEAGSDVLLVDEGGSLGGQIWRHAMEKPHGPFQALAWLERLRRSKTRIETGACVVLRRVDGPFLAERDGKPVLVEAGKAILATGARERFLPFPGWTLPGVLGVGGAQALLKAGASFRGKRVVIAGSGPLLLPVAASLSRGGARIEAVAEQASGTNVAGFGLGLWRRPAKVSQAIRYRASFPGARYRTGTWVAAAHGSTQIESVTLRDGGRTWTAQCDVLACAYGLVPNVELPRSLGCAVENGFVRVDAEQRTDVPSVWAVGEPTGIGGVEKSLVEGEIAGLSAMNREISGAL
jgi:D-hydroxyproline dehydrogenase subunit alpha